MKKALTDKHGEVRELTSDDFRAMDEPSKVLPEELVAILPKRGRPKVDRPKKQLTIRLNQDVVDFFKSTGNGWQTRINDVLLEYVNSHKMTQLGDKAKR